MPKKTAKKELIAKPIKKSTKKTSEKKPVVKKPEPKTMEELLKKTGYTLKGLKKGQLVKGVITDITKKMILIDIGAKTEGVVVDKEYEAAREMLSDMQIGDEVQAYVGSPENERGQILLSLRQAIIDKRWELFDNYLRSGEPIEVKWVEVNKGGIIVKVKGIRGFVPSSQFGRQYLGHLNELQNKSFVVKVIEVNKDKNRLIFSEKAVSESTALARQAEAIKEVKVGDELEGVVSGIMPFGVFVRANIKANGKKEALFLEGLVHISEISWEKVDNPANFFKVGDKLRVKVIGLDEKTSRLNLSIKQLTEDPWKKLAEKYPEGAKVTGRVTRLAAFGAFVNLEPGVDGLIHISKIPAEKEFKAGQKIECFVERVDAENRRMSLSLALTSKPVGYK